MKTDGFNKIQKDFFTITRIFLKKRPCNSLNNKVLSDDSTFSFLAEKVFDYPKILKILKEKVDFWLSIDKTEPVLLLAGYIFYLDGDFYKAKNHFLKAVEANPSNLDNWLDLAFCLYRCPGKLNLLAKDILFNCDLFIKFFEKFQYEKVNLKTLGQIQKHILDKKLGYRYTYRKFIDRRDLKTIIKK